ncbi:response regulator transcription factor [Streptomyces sp. NPDC058045]|uniref:helix-turn-helix transcriptional regulator n=1 Tax=Streptomyces sp. NPDC058045 TaxID=3346311 RepID=UPI0036E8BE9E
MEIPDAAEVSLSSEDEVDEALLEMRKLIETVVAKRRDRNSEGQLLMETASDVGVAEQALRSLLGDAKQVKVVFPSDAASVELLCRTLRSMRPETLGSVQVQALCSRQFAMCHQMAERPAEAAEFGPEVDVRITKAVLHGAVLIDEEIALTQSDRSTGAHATLVRDPAVVKTLNSLFVSAWRHAATPAGSRVRQEFPQEILRCLRQGYTDEAAARELGVSVRTYRRHVAEIMRELGANSRFQAGVYASELGLLPADGRPGPQRVP